MVTYNGKNPKLWKGCDTAPLPASPLPAVFLPRFRLSGSLCPAPGLGAPCLLPTCSHPNPPRTLPRQRALTSLPVQAAGPRVEAAGHGITFPGKSPPPSQLPRVLGWVGLQRELKVGGYELVSCWKLCAWRLLGSQKQGQLLP